MPAFVQDIDRSHLPGSFYVATVNGHHLLSFDPGRRERARGRESQRREGRITLVSPGKGLPIVRQSSRW